MSSTIADCAEEYPERAADAADHNVAQRRHEHRELRRAHETGL
jgi:hypothetical protein